MPYEEDKLQSENSEKNGLSESTAPEPTAEPIDVGKSAPAPDHAVGGPELDQVRTNRQEAAKKIEELFHHTENRLNQIDGQLEQLPKMVQNTVIQVIKQFQDESARAAPGPAIEGFQNMSKEDKVMLMTEAGKSVADIIGALKGGSGSGPEGAGPDFKTIMADWGMRMFQFHLDNMAQSVYQIKLPPPPDISSRSLGPKSQPNFQVKPGVHKFE